MMIHLEVVPNMYIYAFENINWCIHGVNWTWNMHIMIVWHEKEDCRIPSIMWFGFPPMMILCDLTNKLYVLKLNQYVYWKFSWYTDEIFVCIWGCFACIYLLSAFSICVLMSWILPLCSHICIVYIVDVCGLCSKFITCIDD